jgi:FkbM family methyltransferase
MNRELIFLRPVFLSTVQFLRRLIRVVDPYGRTSYAQEGEDLLLERIFEGQKSGFYIDIGAHHPLRFSNTYLLYKRGWRGINIDAMPGSMAIFQRLRPKDICIESGVALSNGQLTYFVFKEKALNTFDEQLAQHYKSSGHEVSQQLQVRTKPLTDLLNEYLPTGQQIDLLSVDVEGFDLDVLKSNDWQRFRPRVLITEELRPVSGEKNTSVHEFLIGIGYHKFAGTYNSVFYVSDEGLL